MNEKNTYQPRLKTLYFKEIQPQLMQEFKYQNIMQVPKMQKIVLNMGVGEAVKDNKIIHNALEDMTRIAGQKPVIIKAKKSEASFKLRAGMPIGIKVTLRKQRMYEFVDRLITIALPRVRDFRGLSPRAFDKNGNFAFGIHEHIVFPEIDYDKTDRIRGLDVIICTSAKTDDEAHALLKKFNFPFRQGGRENKKVAA